MRHAGCRLQDKCQQSTCSVCTMYVHGIVASEKCWASEEGSEGERSYSVEKRGAWAVGLATDVSEAYTMCVQCTYMEESLPGMLRSPAEP